MCLFVESRGSKNCGKAEDKLGPVWVRSVPVPVCPGGCETLQHLHCTWRENHVSMNLSESCAHYYFALPNRTTSLNDSNFIMRMLYGR